MTKPHFKAAAQSFYQQVIERDVEALAEEFEQWYERGRAASGQAESVTLPEIRMPELRTPEDFLDILMRNGWREP